MKILIDEVQKMGLFKKDAYAPDTDFIPSQLRRGIEVELEHTPYRWLAKMIAKVHLKENPKYYTYLDAMEKQMDAEKKVYVPQRKYDGSRSMLLQKRK